MSLHVFSRRRACREALVLAFFPENRGNVEQTRQTGAERLRAEKGTRLDERGVEAETDFTIDQYDWN